MDVLRPAGWEDKHGNGLSDGYGDLHSSAAVGETDSDSLSIDVTDRKSTVLQLGNVCSMHSSV